MLFNKKSDDELGHDFSPKRLSTAIYSVDAVPMPSRRPSGAPTRSVIDAWLHITGDLHSEGEVQVDGHIHGHICCTHLTVGKDASIVGNITAEEVVVRGKVKGVIRANRIILQDSARVDGEIFHKRLAIEEGAMFEGQSRFSEEPTKAALLDLHTMASHMKGSGKTNGRLKMNENGAAHA